MMKIKSLMVAMFFAMPAMSFAQSEVTQEDNEFDISTDQQTTDSSTKVSNRKATKTTTTTVDVVTPVVEEIEEVITTDTKQNAVPVIKNEVKANATVISTDPEFDNITVPNEVNPTQVEQIIEEVVDTPRPATVEPVTTTVSPVTTSTAAPSLRTGRIENIDDVTVPENMFALDSLLTLYSTQTYLAVDEECNLPNYNPEYDEATYIQRLSKLPTVMEMPYNEVVRQMIDRYAVKNRRGVSAMLATQNLYMPIFEEALEAYGLPLELKYLPIIESGLNPTAVSRAGAGGLWQFMPATAKKYGLEINSLVDERCDPVKSSYAAAKLLYEVYKVFGDWNLVIAAYNCGPGNVQKAIHRAGGVYDYWKIYPYLPKETRGYVPAFIAANYIMNYYCEHNICPMVSHLPEQTDTVHVTKDLRMDAIAKVLNIPVKQIQELNPSYRQGIINGGSTKDKDGAILRLPTQQIIAFVDNEAQIYSGNAPYKRATVTPGYSGSDSSYTPVTTTTAAPAEKPAPTTTTTAATTTSSSTTASTSGSQRNRRGSSRSQSTATTAAPATTTTQTTTEAPSKYSKESSSKESGSSSSRRESSSRSSRHDSKRDSSSRSSRDSKADASKDSKTDSKSSRTDSKNSKTDSRTSKTDSKTSKTDSSKTSKTDPKNSKADASKTSKTDSKSSKSDSSKTSKTDSKTSKTDASKTSKTDSKTSKTDSKTSKTDASKTSKTSTAAKKEPTPRKTSSSGTASHTVKDGETLSHIAARNGTTVTELRKKNPNIKGDVIRPGDKVRVK